VSGISKLRDYLELSDLVVKLVAYKYRIFVIVVELVLLVFAFILAILVSLYFQIAQAITLPPWLVGLLLTLVFFVPLFLVAGLLWRIFSKSLSKAQALARMYEGKKRIDSTKIFALSYTVPYIVLYAIPPPIPNWRVIAWFYAWGIAHLLIAVFYERPLGKLNPNFKTQLFRNAAILTGVLGIPVLYASAVLDMALAAQLTVLAYLIVYLVVAVVEIYRAEKLL